MEKYRAIVEYDGTAYHGWQLQKNLPTVQGEMESVLARILGTPTRVHGAGRTDAGVHARGQTAHFEARWRHGSEKLHKACNALLPRDISVRRLDVVPKDFHARHSARSKTYVYGILNRALPSPLQRLYTWHVPIPLNASLMAEAAGHLPGSHDFAAFGSPTDGTPSTVREMFEARMDVPGPGLLSFTVTGTGFLRYMVRSLVGTLVEVGRGKMSPAVFLAVLESADRSMAGPTAPARGLSLESVQYE
ncbi:MAG: tRNA pseudouridine(38-40) synthase TruA [Pseudomonadota bacterium]